MSCPAKNHETGVSIWSTGSFSPPPPGVNMAPRLLKARAALRHCSATESSPDVNMQATPPHRVHWTSSP